MQWKLSVIIIALKSGEPPKPPLVIDQYSVFYLFSKVLKKLHLKRTKLIMANFDIVLNIQLGFRSRHLTMKQIKLLTNTIASLLENKQYCTTVFLDVMQAFDQVSHDGLLIKLKYILPQSNFTTCVTYFFNLISQNDNLEHKSLNHV